MESCIDSKFCGIFDNDSGIYWDPHLCNESKSEGSHSVGLSRLINNSNILNDGTSTHLYSEARDLRVVLVYHITSGVCDPYLEESSFFC